MWGRFKSGLRGKPHTQRRGGDTHSSQIGSRSGRPLLREKHADRPFQLNLMGAQGELREYDTNPFIEAIRDDRPARVSATTATAAQRGRSVAHAEPDPIISVADYIGLVQEVERAYPADTPERIVTRIRLLYYNGPRFRQLIRYAVAPRANHRIPRETYRRLTARANENGVRDNPSPYICLPPNEQIDIGHVLVGLDALLHPGSGIPYDAYSVPTIDPASWVGDLSGASLWMTRHEQRGRLGPFAHHRLPYPDLDAYYEMSAPLPDMLGNADAFGLRALWGHGRLPLSQLLRDYYTAPAAGVSRRWQIFCVMNAFEYTWDGSAITWDTDLRDYLIIRINKLCDLGGSGDWGALLRAILRIPRHETWPHTPAVTDRFLSWLKAQLEAELSEAELSEAAE